jgi:iron(III) transport system ATP-binding protein
VARALHAAHATAIMVTHDQNEALSLADQVAVMRGGRLAQVAAPDVVYTKPADPDTATFVGAAALPTARIDGGVAHCALGPLPVPPGSAQGAARLLIRPEHLQLRTHPAPGGVPARVTDVTYFGHDASVHLVLEPGGPHITARIMGTGPPEPDALVHVVVRGPVTVYSTTAGDCAANGVSGPTRRAEVRRDGHRE